MYLTIDGGTTNTRVFLTDGNTVLDNVKKDIGARMGAGEDKNQKLSLCLKESIDTILEKNNLCESDIEAIIASGMITSGEGLFEINHISAPAGINELSLSLTTKKFSDISNIPISFIPGVKNNDVNKEAMDVMRGEETETVGIISKMDIPLPAVILIPGSHNKIIFVDKCGKIKECISTLSGELIRAACENTILKSSVEFSRELDLEYLKKGYDISEKYSLSYALFKTRILRNFQNAPLKSLYSYVVGVVMHEDIMLLNKMIDCENVYVGGNDTFKNAILYLTKDDNRFYEIPTSVCDAAQPVGAVEIYKKSRT